MARHRLPRVRVPVRSDAVLPWVPMLVGVAIMAGYVIYALMLRAGYQPVEDDTDLVVPSPPVTTAAPDAPDPTGGIDPASESYERRAEPPPYSPTASPTPPEPPPDPTSDPPPAPDVTGEYGVDATFDDVFIGKVVIVNHARQAQDWTVKLAFPSNVGKLNTFWVDGTPQPTLRVRKGVYIFTSTVPVEGRSEVTVKFHFDRSGEDVPPEKCTVNGTECT